MSAISSLSPYRVRGIRKAILIFILLTAWMMSSQAMAADYGANLVLNGDAETNSLANWTNSGPVFVALSPSAVGVSNSPSGGYAFDYYPGSASGNESLSQIIDITDLAADIAAGSVKAVLSGEVKKYYAASNCILRVQELDASNALLHTSEIDGNTSGDVWVTTEVTVTNLNWNTRKLNVILYAQVSTNTDDYIEFDNIQLTLYRTPTLTTTSVSTYGATSATLGGNVTANGGATVTERGVVYSSTDATPTIGETGVTQDTNGVGSGTFSESIASLSPGTTYYVQAYATNSVGTSYGGVVSFTTSPLATITFVSVPGNGTYIIGQNLDFTVNFSAAVTVVTTGGIPSLPLTIGGVAKHATYVSGSGTTALVFRYTLVSGDAGALATGTGIALNGGTIKDGAGNNATLTFTAPTTSGITIDATAPSINSFNPPISGTYIFGQNLDFIVSFSEPVNVDITNGMPYMVLTVGSKSVHADYQSGSGTNSLVFRYVVAANDYDADGVELTLGITLDGGTIKDIAGNPAFLIAGPAVTVNGLNVDAVLPTISISAPLSSSTISGPVDFTVTYSDTNFDISTLASGDITLNKTGTADATTINITGSGNTRTVTLSGISGSGTLGISIAAGTASDNAGNTAPAAGPSSTFHCLYRRCDNCYRHQATAVRAHSDGRLRIFAQAGR